LQYFGLNDESELPEFIVPESPTDLFHEEAPVAPKVDSLDA
jgi:hypothetical protein